MDEEDELLVCVAAAQFWLSMMAVIVEYRNRIRHNHAPAGQITYAPICERDRKRFEYLNDKIWKDDVTCVNMLRLNRASFFRFCKLFRDRGLLDIEEPTQKEDEDFVAASSAIHDKEDTAGSASRPFKKVKRDDRSVDPLVQAVENGSQTLANAINNVAASKIVPPDLFAALDSLPGFEMEQKSKYYSYMLEHPNIAHGFMNVPLLYKISMLTDFIIKNM